MERGGWLPGVGTMGASSSQSVATAYSHGMPALPYRLQHTSAAISATRERQRSGQEQEEGHWPGPRYNNRTPVPSCCHRKLVQTSDYETVPTPAA